MFSHRNKLSRPPAAAAAARAVSRVDAPLILHASAVAVAGRAALILGGSGAGKSGLALEMMALGARLVADDRVVLARRGAALVASAPPALRGLIEARGLGLLRAEPLAAAPVALAVDLDVAAAARMPHLREITYLGVEIELISVKGVPTLAAALIQMLQCGRAG